ncbi:TatD family hydrolase [Elusimicrobiota bacterium]
MIDTHTHLTDPWFDKDRDEVIERAFQSGIEKIVEIATEPKEWEPTLKLCQKYPGKILCAIGFHPHCAHEWNDSYEKTLLDLARDPLVLGFGEIGIDYAKSAADPNTQKQVFEKLLSIANEASKPIILHCREGGKGRAHDDMFEVLENVWEPMKTFSSERRKRSQFSLPLDGGGQGGGDKEDSFITPHLNPPPQGGRKVEQRGGKRFSGVQHCFSGDLNNAKKALSMKLAIGIDGPITYPKNDKFRKTILDVGLDNIVLETDCPYLPPQSIRGKRNEPSKIPEIAQSLADLFNVPLNEVIKVTTRNAVDLFEI